ncbi:ABC transporter ATP-binding protein [Diaminobutyricimonas sp. LJ205]|uniref:ABC transporter ATP-binding protein n=1 Tax=Diaminobutyricimonas sp. LJ205 TaxID=2683590 RepID=UPI0012F485A7|nr:ABC transporter ATP-binding protein [Diaminobutyricimonas sp. LJ205]
MTLSVENMSIHFDNIPVVRNVTFALKPGGSTALIGESGSGKSLTGLAIMGLLPENMHVAGGRAILGDTDLLALAEPELVKMRGPRVAMIFQDTLSALNPVHTIGRQLVECLRLHGGPSGAAARRRAIELLDMVRIPDPETRLRAYPHQLSGGQRQRVVIAMALACEPEVLIADEPTTALDVRVQAEIISLLKSITRETGTSLLLITHDLPVASRLCDEVLVMYGGRIVEAGRIDSTLVHPFHPYTAGLVAATPSDDWGNGRLVRLPTIPGHVPPLNGFPSGCPFRDRCTSADELCSEMPATRVLSSGRSDGSARHVACWHDLSEVGL